MVVTEKLTCPCGLVFNDPKYLAIHTVSCTGSSTTINQEAVPTATVTPATVTPFVPMAPVPTVDTPASTAFFTDYGKNFLHELAKVHPDPVMVIGETGGGKSYAVRYVANEKQSIYSSINAHPAMDISQLIGMYRPANQDGNIVVEWEHGVLTEAVEKGMTFFFEEATRMSPEAAGRLFGILDTTDRYYNLMERGGDDIKVHDDFWLVATANPTGNGYHTQALDPALRSRFAAIFEIKEPIADEKAILANMLPQHSSYQSKMYRFILDSRSSHESSINTRDMVLACRLINKGFTPMRAIELAILPKYPGQSEGLKQNAYNLFEAGGA